jgi:hypothetical protein
MTKEYISKRKCYRCGRRPGYATWNVCADGNRNRIVCWACDKAMNRLVLRWMNDPNWKTKCESYESRHDLANRLK